MALKAPVDDDERAVRTRKRASRGFGCSSARRWPRPLVSPALALAVRSDAATLNALPGVWRIGTASRARLSAAVPRSRIARADDGLLPENYDHLNPDFYEARPVALLRPPPGEPRPGNRQRMGQRQ